MHGFVYNLISSWNLIEKCIKNLFKSIYILISRQNRRTIMNKINEYQAKKSKWQNYYLSWQKMHIFPRGCQNNAMILECVVSDFIVFSLYERKKWLPPCGHVQLVDCHLCWSRREIIFAHFMWHKHQSRWRWHWDDNSE